MVKDWDLRIGELDRVEFPTAEEDGEPYQATEDEDTVRAVRIVAFRWKIVRIRFEVFGAKQRVLRCLNTFGYYLGRFGKMSKSTPKSRFLGSETSFWTLPVAMVEDAGFRRTPSRSVFGRRSEQ